VGTTGQSMTSACLVVAIGQCFLALPVSSVIETMRPLPIDPMSGLPPFVLGLSVIRGTGVPVLDLAIVLGLKGSGEVSRFVAVKIGEQTIALAVNAVVGLHELDNTHLDELPALLGSANADVVDAIGVLDAQLLFLLRAGRLLPPEVWENVAGEEAAP
jgi:purine-binding chemotaxis protein CheW